MDAPAISVALQADGCKADDYATTGGRVPRKPFQDVKNREVSLDEWIPDWRGGPSPLRVLCLVCHVVGQKQRREVCTCPVQDPGRMRRAVILRCKFAVDEKDRRRAGAPKEPRIRQGRDAMPGTQELRGEHVRHNGFC